MNPNSMPTIGLTLSKFMNNDSLFDSNKKTSGIRWLIAAITALLTALVPITASAATIGWGAATTIASTNDVSTNGSALYAYAGGLATATTNLNGVIFTQGSGFATWGNVSFTSGFTGSSANGFTIASSPYQDLPSAYTNALRGAAFGGTAAGTVTLNGLTAGHDYSVQIWVNDPRAAGNGRTETITGSGVTLDYNNFDAPGGVGQYAVGYFVADNTNQSFSLTPSASGSVQLNAISVRDIGLSSRTWLGSTDTSWGTAGNWTPANIPIFGDAIIFNNLSTANLSTVPDVSYTMSTLTLSNTASPVSIGGANTMTVSGGINLIGASQSLTITAPLVFSASQTWNVTNSSSTLAVNGGLSGGAVLTIAGAGTVSIGGAATYTGNTIISNGRLAIGSAGTLASTNITIAGGAIFDVSAESPNYALNGNRLNNSSAGAVISGTSDLSSGTISMTYDGVNPPFVQTNGTLTLSGSTVINVNIPGTVLGAGNYTLIAAATLGNVGQVTGSLPSVNITGNGAVGAVTLAINGSGGLDMVVTAPAVWTGLTDNTWITGNNWLATTEPAAADSILFNNLSAANLNITQNDPSGGVQFGVTVINPSGPVTIGGPNSLTTYGGGLNLSAASQNLTVSAPLVINADQNWLVTNSRTLTISGPVTTVSGGNVTFSGGGKLVMGAAHVLDGLTNASPGAGDFTVNSSLDLNGNPQAMNGLKGSSGGTVDNTGAGAITLALGGNTDNSTFSGVIQNTGGALALDVLAGNLTLNSSSNTYSGGTTFESGTTLSFPSATAKYGTGPVTFKPGAKSYTSANIFTNALSLDSCYLRVGGGNLNVQNWTGPITITNGFLMSGDAGAGGVTLSGPINIGTGGISITNSINNGGNQGFGVSTTGDLLSGVISGSGGITYYCNGSTSRLTVQGANTYSGNTVVNGTGNGKLNVWNGVNPFSTGTVTLNAGAIIEAAPGSATITNALTLNGGTLESEAQFNNYNTLTWSGPITLTADSALVQFENSTLNNNQSVGVIVSGPLNMNGFTLTCSSPFDAFGGSTISGPISGAGNINYNSFANNTLTISGSNTFSGTFRSGVTGGTGKLSIANVYALQNATLDMNAADAGNVSLNNRDVVIGALTGSRNLSLGVGSVSIGKNNASTTFDGVLSGSGSLTKIGSGTLTLTANTYTGNTTVNAGTLSMTQPNLALSSTVKVASGAVLNLNYVGTNVVLALVLNGVSQPNGVYKSTTPGGYISGTGAIQVLYSPYAWSGGLSSEWSVNVLASPKNWTNNGIAADYIDNNTVLFDDTLKSNSLVAISVANVTPTQVAFNNNKTNYTIGGGFGITGTGSLIKNGSANVTLTNNNTYTGNTIINSNLLTIGGAGRLGVGGTNTGGIYINAGATFEYGSTSGQNLAGPITGAGGLLKSGATKSDLTLSSTINTYTGPTTITNGRVFVSSGANLGGGTTVVQTNAGQLYISAATTISNPLNISSIGYPEADAYGNNFDGAVRCDVASTLAGTITLSGNARIGNYNAAGVTFTISGQITGGYGIDFYGMNGANGNSRTFLLSNTGNNFTGNANIFCNDFNAARTTATNTLRLGASEVIPNGVGRGNVVFNGADANHLTILEMNGFNETVNGVSNVSATGAIIRNTITGASTLTIGDANTNSTYSGIITDGGTGKSLALTKIGTGTLTLSGANAYNGVTTINGGTLLINGATGTGTGAVNINSGGALGGIGSISGLVTNNAGGILSPGLNGTNKLTLSGNVTLLSGSTNTFVVNGTTPTNNSVILGASVIYGGVLNIVTNGTFTVGQQFLLFTGAGATNASNFASIVGSAGSGKLFSFTNGVLSVVSSGPTLTSVTPNPLTGSGYGATLNLTGSGFTGATAVLLTNVTAAAGANYAPTVNSDTSISVTFVPGTSAATWNATVVNGAPSAQVGFTVIVPTKVNITGDLNAAGAGKLVLSGTGGVAGNKYAVQSTTNLAPPVVWSSLVTNVFGSGGSFSYTNTISPSTPSLFLRIAQ